MSHHWKAPRDFQSNNHDCGPFICGYAEKLCHNKQLTGIDIAAIRKRTSVLINSQTSFSQVGNQLYGCGEEYVYFTDQHMVLLYQSEIKSRQILVLDPSINRAIAVKDNDTIIEFLSFKFFKNRSMILCPVLFRKSKWVLITIDLKNETVSGYDTQTLECGEKLQEISKTFGELIKVLTFAANDFKITEPTKMRQIQKLTGESSPLVFGYIKCILNGTSLIRINLKSIRSRAGQLMIKNKNNAKLDTTALVSANKKPINSLGVRCTMATAVSAQMTALSLDDMQKKFTDYIKEICPIKESGKIFLGDHDKPRPTSDLSLRKTYNKSPATAFEKIVNNTIADCCPEEKSLHLHY